MINIYEYILNRKQKVFKGSSLDILEKNLKNSIFKDMKKEDSNGYLEAICDVLLDLYNSGSEYIINSDENFKNIDKNFKGFRIKYNVTTYCIEIYNIENLTAIYITFDSIKIYLYTIPENRKNELTKERMIKSLGEGANLGIAYQNVFISRISEEKNLNDFKEKLNKLVYK
jgi:hypothetical protein